MLSFCLSLLVFVVALLAMAFLTLLERKLMAIVQLSLGPNVMGLYGFFQPIADGLKLLVKSTTMPLASNVFLFLLCPFSILFFSLLLWVVMPFGPGVVLSDLNLGMMFLLGCSSLNVHAVAFAGWSSQSAYALLGAMSSVAQLISYELVLSSIMLSMLALTGSLNLSLVASSQSYGVYGMTSLTCLFPIYLITMLGETNSAPFDLPEAEAELVAGYNVEYGGGAFALFFLAEYSSILIFSMLGSVCFIGAWLYPISVVSYSMVFASLLSSAKASCLVIAVVIVSAAYPSYSFDQLMLLGWKALLPFTFSYCLVLFTCIFFSLV